MKRTTSDGIFFIRQFNMDVVQARYQNLTKYTSSVYQLDVESSKSINNCKTNPRSVKQMETARIARYFSRKQEESVEFNWYSHDLPDPIITEYLLLKYTKLTNHISITNQISE